MAIQFLKVIFPEDRTVLADGDPIGPTNATLMLETGDYAITIQGGHCTPASQDIVLNNTTVTSPMIVTFSLAAGATTTPRTPAL
ncbi:MAG: PEGA domain-containing protein [Alphaproteobacteria bacterium]